MVKKIITALLLIAALGGGLYLGMTMHQQQVEAEADKKKRDAGIAKKFEYVKLSKSLTIPLVENNKVVAMLVAEIVIEGAEGLGDAFKPKEPLLRDGLLRVLYKHANRGVFRDKLLTERTQADLRYDMTVTAKEIFGADKINAVLMNDFQRQEM